MRFVGCPSSLTNVTDSSDDTEDTDVSVGSFVSAGLGRLLLFFRRNGRGAGMRIRANGESKGQLHPLSSQHFDFRRAERFKHLFERARRCGQTSSEARAGRQSSSSQHNEVASGLDELPLNPIKAMKAATQSTTTISCSSKVTVRASCTATRAEGS